MCGCIYLIRKHPPRKGKKMARRRFTEYEKRVVAAKQGWRCAICNHLLPASFHADHKVPHAVTRETALENCQALCGTCHGEKTAQEAAKLI